jgi:diacylglycerol O-acyltransferase / wax synthase
VPSGRADKERAHPRGSRIARLTTVDVSYMAVESEAWLGHYGALAILEGAGLLDSSGRLRLEELRARLGRRLGRSPLLRRRVLFPGPWRGRPLWVDDDRFAIENHVLEVAVPTPGTEAQLLETAARAYEKLLDRSRPLWEIWLLTGLAGGRVGALLKLHHSMADGLAAVTLIGSLLDTEPDAPLAAAAAPWSPEPAPGDWVLFRDNLAGKARAVGRRFALLVQPRRVVRAALYFGRVVRHSLAAAKTASTALNRPVGAGRTVRFLRLDLAAMKELAHAHGGKVNDVVLALWAGGLRVLLQSRGEAVDGVQVNTGLAVSLRSEDGPDDANQVGVIVVPLPVAEAEASHRLEAAVATTRRVKAEQDPAAAARAMVGLAATLVARYGMLHQRTMNVFASNLAGPPTPLYGSGIRVADVIPIGDLRGNVGLNLNTLSYDGRAYLAVTADAGAHPDLDVLMAAMERDWQELAGRAPG